MPYSHIGSSRNRRRGRRRRRIYLHIGYEAIKAAIKFNQYAYNLSPGLDTSKIQSDYTKEPDA
jgi:hypothetical protein